MRAMAMPNAQRLGLFLLLVACAPLIMAAGGGPCELSVVRGTVFNDLNRDFVRDIDDPVLSGVAIRVYLGGVLWTEVSSNADGVYESILSFPGIHTVCEVLPPTWSQTGPAMGGDDIGSSCMGLDDSVNLAPVGYVMFGGGCGGGVFEGLNFGNVTTDEGMPRISTVEGTKFHDFNRNGVRDPGEPGLERWLIHAFGSTNAGAVVHQAIFTNPDGIYRFALEPGTYTLCEERFFTRDWTQTAPVVGAISPGLTLADCTSHTEGGTIALEPAGYSFTLAAGVPLQGADFGNTLSVIKGVKFNDLNGNAVQDAGEPGLPDWEIHLVEDKPGALQLQPGPPVRATIRVDRHTRRPPGGEQGGTCPNHPGCSTTMGGRVSIVLTQGSLRAEAVFTAAASGFPGGPPHVIQFELGCVPGLTLDDELLGVFVPDPFGDYLPISKYGLPQDLLPGLFAKLGIAIDRAAYFPIIKEVLTRTCVADPNPANGAAAGVTNPGILVVEAEIGFVSTVNKVVVASTSTNAAGEYEMQVRPGTYTVCESLSPGWRQTFPGTGLGSASCTGTGTALGPRGHVFTLVDPGQVVSADFGNAAFSGLTAVRDTQLWLGLKSSDDQGTLFDVKVELLKNGSPVASGLRRCVVGLTRNPRLAADVVVAWDAFNPVPLRPADVLALRISTRIGTNPDDSKCSPARGSSHTSARGVRLYYDAASQPSRVDATLGPGSSRVLYLDSDGTVCPAGGAESRNVTDRILTDTPPSSAAAKCKDSSAVAFGSENLFKEVGTWTLR